MSPAGPFITFEGGEGVGKSTQARMLADHLRQGGCEVVLTREPGGTEAAERLRALLLAPDADWSERAEILLHFAARAEHLDRLILPALERGAVVISDRFADSTLAYQGWGRAADRGLIGTLTGLLPRHPDRTIVLDIDRETRQARVAARGLAPDRYEREADDFHERVAAGFRAIARANPARCRIINASGPVDAVQQAVRAAIARQVPETGPA